MPFDQNDGSAPPSGKSRGRGENGLPTWLVWVVIAVVGLVVVSALSFSSNATEPIAFSTFTKDVEQGNIKSITWDNVNQSITGETKSGETFTTTGPTEPTPELLKTMQDKGVEVEFATPTPNLFTQLLPLLLPIAVIIGFFVWMNRRAQGQMSGIMSIGRSRAKTYTTERPATLFGDVAGYDGVKREVREVVDFLKEPDRFLEIGARIPKGILLVGPPGTGKTLIARAVAGEAGVPFLSVSGSDFMEMFVGVGASRVRDLFESARKHGRAIIFVDEIDSIGRKRGAGLGGGHDEREQTLNQMLSEMDGFEASDGIVMMAATNRPDVLDPALLRPGRFDRQVVVPFPELDDRKAILAVHSKHKKLSSDVDLNLVARGTPGMSGADLANLVNESALTAVRRGSKVVEMHDFEDARDRVLMGQRRDSMVLSDREKEITAYHEGGHAVVAELLPNADPVHKVTILPRGMALGVTQQLPEEEKHSYSQEYLEESIVVAMGGRVAEELIFDHRSTGAANDLQVSTERARKMVTEFGMSDRIGPRAWGTSGPVFLGEDFGHQREYSEDTTRLIDGEVEKLLRESEERCVALLTQNRKALDLVAAALLEHETISGSEVSRLIRVSKGTEPDVSSTVPPSAVTQQVPKTSAPVPPPVPTQLSPQPNVFGWPGPRNRPATD
ncbi:MAG: ATP-dependent zinc metalloprotease FtsH [Acidimicrobiales bacterium]